MCACTLPLGGDGLGLQEHVSISLGNMIGKKKAFSQGNNFKWFLKIMATFGIDFFFFLICYLWC